MRDIKELHPILQYKIEQLKKLCEENDLKIGISECYRTVDEQNELYEQGRTTPGRKVTNANGTTYSSMHQWGIAFDFYRDDEEGAYYDADGFFTKVGKLGQSIGLEWGGAWRRPVDKPHFQLPYWGSTTRQLKQMYGTFSNFQETWFPEAPTKTVKTGSCANDVGYAQMKVCMLTPVNICIDRRWGKKTSKGIYKYQKSLGWNPSGKAGKKTLKAMKKNRTK